VYIAVVNQYHQIILRFLDSGDGIVASKGLCLVRFITGTYAD